MKPDSLPPDLAREVQHQRRRFLSQLAGLGTLPLAAGLATPARPMAWPPRPASSSPVRERPASPPPRAWRPPWTAPASR
jgi:hypothetical protein